MHSDTTGMMILDDSEKEIRPYFPFWCGYLMFLKSDDDRSTGSTSTNENHHPITSTNTTTTVIPTASSAITGARSGTTAVTTDPTFPSTPDVDVNHLLPHHHLDDINNSNYNVKLATTTTTTTTDRNKKQILHGLAIDTYGRATIGMASILLGPALLTLANHAAQMHCTASNNNQNINDNTSELEVNCETSTTLLLYGFRPSSLLTNIATVSGILAALIIPIVGSIMDHTPYRHSIGYSSGLVLCIIKLMEFIALSLQDTTTTTTTTLTTWRTNIWLYIALGQIVSAGSYYIHLTTTYAYLSEVSQLPKQQSRYNTTLFIILYVSTLLFMIQVISTSSIVASQSSNDENGDTQNSNSNSNSTSGSDDIATAQIALGTTVLICTSCMVYSWRYYFPLVPAKAPIPMNQTIYTVGFHTLYHTLQQFRSVLMKLHPNRIHHKNSYHSTSIVPIVDTSESSSNSNDRDDNNHYNPVDRSGTITTLTARHPDLHSTQENVHHDNHLCDMTCSTNSNNNNNDTEFQRNHTAYSISTPTPLQKQRQYRAMFYILCSVSLSEAAANAIIVVSTTYMKEILQMSANQSYVQFIHVS
jgi:hypothetical protein